MAKITPGSPVFDRWGISAGDFTIPRELAIQGCSTTSGQLRLCYFTATRTEICNQIRTVTAGTVAATVTMARMGVYSVATNGDLTLVASCPNDTTLWGSGFTGWPRALSAPWQKIIGQRYATAMICVATTMPQLGGLQVESGGELATVSPRITGAVNGQTDLPASIAAGSVTSAAGIIYFSVTP